MKNIHLYLMGLSSSLITVNPAFAGVNTWLRYCVYSQFPNTPHITTTFEILDVQCMYHDVEFPVSVSSVTPSVDTTGGQLACPKFTTPANFNGWYRAFSKASDTDGDLCATDTSFIRFKVKSTTDDGKTREKTVKIGFIAGLTQTIYLWDDKGNESTDSAFGICGDPNSVKTGQCYQLYKPVQDPNGYTYFVYTVDDTKWY